MSTGPPPRERRAPGLGREREGAGVTPFSTPFDEADVDFFETLDVPWYTIASFEDTDLPLISIVDAIVAGMSLSCL
jgi:N-acetylneuraminate synthase